MKKYIIPVIFCCASFISAFYVPSISWLFAGGYLDKNSIIHRCFTEHSICIDFKTIIRGDPPYRSGYLKITNNKTGQFAKINDYFMSINDHLLMPTEFVWQGNHQLNVYLEGKKGGITSKFFFKNLDNLSVILYRN